MLAFFEVGLQVHLEKWGTAGIVGAAHWPIVTAALVIPVQRWDPGLNQGSVVKPGTGGGEYLLSGTKLYGEGASPGVHLKGAGLPHTCRATAVPAVDEKLPNLLSHRNVVHHHCQLGVVHRTFLWGKAAC